MSVSQGPKRLFLAAIMVLAFCMPGPKAYAGRMKVFVSIVPQEYFVHRIGGDRVDISVMVPPGANPATYEPRPRQMADVGSAVVYFAIGVPFERIWLEKIAAANPQMRIVHTEEGIEKRSMAAYYDILEGGSRKKKKGHGEGIRDPHIWLSPPLAMIQARNILKALLEIDPGGTSYYEDRYKAFILNLVDLDMELTVFFADKKGCTFMVMHPSWGYFAQAYGLRQVCIEVEGKEPKSQQLGSLVEYARNQGIRTLFFQPEFPTKSAGIVAKAIGGKLVAASALAKDWDANLRRVARKIREALR